MKQDDMTIIYYTANNNNPHFMANTQRLLLDAVGDTPIISVSFEPTTIGKNCTNICIGKQKRSNYMLYKQILIGAKAAKTEFVAMAEDDTLYPMRHFDHRPPEDTLSYDLNKWSVFSWTDPPIFSMRENRRTMNTCVAPRETLVKTLEERFMRWPVFEEIPKNTFDYYFGEPGRFENHLDIPTVKTEKWNCKDPMIMFSTPEALGFKGLGTRKAHSHIRAIEIPYWGRAQDMLNLYKDPSEKN